MKTANKPEVNHAEQNARGWAETISSLVAALECDYKRLEELRDERDALDTPATQAGFATFDASDEGQELRDLTEAATVDGDQFENSDDVMERIQESPLSVELRSGWYTPGDKPEHAEEFNILLSTGGPALRIVGELDEHGQPDHAYLQYQDWGTPWTEAVGVIERETLLTFCQQFYFGE